MKAKFVLSSATRIRSYTGKEEGATMMRTKPEQHEMKWYRNLLAYDANQK